MASCASIRARPVPPGTLDCDGNTGADIDLVTEHGTGTVCLTQEACDADCAVVCGADAVVLPGCEGICQNGPNHNLPCVNDTDCPGGNCPGRDAPTGPHNGLCQCSCSAKVGGTPTAGSLTCNLSSAITVEAALPCDGLDVIIDVGSTCIPLTTATSTGSINNENNVGGTRITPAISGVPTPGCEDLATSITTGTKLVGIINFLDNSTLGDLDVTASFTCQ